jgi:hypothetical protein
MDSGSLLSLGGRHSGEAGRRRSPQERFSCLFYEYALKKMLAGMILFPEGQVL